MATLLIQPLFIDSSHVAAKMLILYPLFSLNSGSRLGLGIMLRIWVILVKEIVIIGVSVRVCNKLHRFCFALN